MSFFRRIRAIVRGACSLVLFAAFGAGALAITPLMLVLRRPERCQPVVRAVWRLATAAFVVTRLIRLDHSRLRSVSGAVLTANHPSLIDVVLLVALVPRTLYVAKRALRGNPILAAIVRATALPDDASLTEKAAPYLAKGWNVLVFPEGTRSPRTGGLRPLRRGAAQVALRTGAPVVCVRIDVSRRLLAKGQKPWDMGSERVTYAFRSDELAPPAEPVRGARAAAVELTERIRARLSA